MSMDFAERVEGLMTLILKVRDVLNYGHGSPQLRIRVALELISKTIKEETK